jgi:hypothetical protein
MFVTDETVNSKSHVIFFRCSLCVSEHVSSEPTFETLSRQTPQQPTAHLLQASIPAP